METTSVIPTTLWSSNVWRALRGDQSAQVLAIYLLTCPYGTWGTPIHIPLGAISFETGLTDIEVANGFMSLRRVHFASYDANNGVVMPLRDAGSIWATGDR